MSVKQLCPKCNSEVLKVRAIGEYKVTLNLDENTGDLVPEVLEAVKEPELDFSVAICGCGVETPLDQLAQGRQSSLSGKWYPIEKLVSWEQDGKTMLATQEEYDKAQAPSVDEMNEEQLREHAKTLEGAVGSLQEQMAQMMAQMQQMMAQQNSQAGAGIAQGEPEVPKAEAPKEEVKKPKATPKTTPTPTPTPQQEQTVATNLPAPGDETGSDEEFNVVDVDGNGGEEAFGEDIFGDDDSPF